MFQQTSSASNTESVEELVCPTPVGSLGVSLVFLCTDYTHIHSLWSNYRGKIQQKAYLGFGIFFLLESLNKLI